MQPTLIGLAISAAVPKFLEYLKSKNWAPFIQHYATPLNRITAIVVSFLVSIGVTIDWDAIHGVLTISGLKADDLIRLGLTWVVNFTLQELVYRKFINDKDQFIGRRGFLVLPILLAVGLGVGCSAKTRGIAVSADGTIATALVALQQGADALVKADCQPGQPCITTAQRRAISPALLKALRLGRSFNEAISSQSAYQLAAGPLLDAILELKEVIAKVVPASLRASLLGNADRALALVGGK